MNAAHYHLLLNHVPVITTFFSVAVLLWGIYLKNETVQKIALLGFIIAGVTVLAVVQSGESTEEIVEEIAAISHDAIEEHEEAADLSKWLTILMGVGGIVGLGMAKLRAKGLGTVLWLLLVFGLVTVGSLSYTGYLGGQIRHAEEINASTQSAGQEEAPERLSNELDED